MMHEASRPQQSSGKADMVQVAPQEMQPELALGCVYKNSLCANLSEQSRVARLAVRDFQYDISVDQTFIPGVDLNSGLFSRVGYTSAAIGEIQSLLDAGLRRLYLDVFWNPQLQQWYVCPEPWRMNVTSRSISPLNPGPGNGTEEVMLSPELPGVCDSSLSFSSILTGIQHYVNLSDTNVAAGLIYMHLRPKTWPKNMNLTTPSIRSLSGDRDLGDTVSAIMGPRLFTPSQLQVARSPKVNQVTRAGTDYTSAANQWPSLRRVLLNYEKRSVVAYSPGGDAIGNAASLSDYAFALNSQTLALNGSLAELAQRPFRDWPALTEADFRYVWQMGASPVLNASLDPSQIAPMLDSSFEWSWAPGQPILYSYEERVSMTKRNKYEACGLLNQYGQDVADCNELHYALCRDNDNTTHWQLSTSLNSYFDSDCPEGFTFAVPRTALEARTVRNSVIASENVWANMNSLFYPNCWVSGGVLAVCPYNVIQGKRNGVASITIAATAAFCMLVAILWFELDRLWSPIRRNPTRPDVSKEQEGVPL